MATTLTTKVIQLGKRKRFDIAELSQKLRKGIDESIGDMIVTVFVTAATLLYMFLNVHPVFLETIPGLYIFAMLIQLMIRVVQRFDADYTVNELATQMVGFEDRINARLDMIEHNQYPL